jgi:hypothetical protein
MIEDPGLGTNLRASWVLGRERLGLYAQREGVAEYLNGKLRAEYTRSRAADASDNRGRRSGRIERSYPTVPARC